MKKILFLLLLALCILPWITPGIALLMGLATAYFSLNPFIQESRRPSKLLIAWSIVGLGATVRLGAIIEISVTYFWLTLSGIVLTIIVGMLIGRYLKVPNVICSLISSGTAICGASAIAAIGSSISAKAEELSMALGVVLILNTVALYLFPVIGHSLHLSPHDFGVWAGLAIHDTSSVVGAALQYSRESLETATTVKLARAIWIAPLSIFFSWIMSESGNRKFSCKLPWFIWGYVLAASLVALFPGVGAYSETIGLIARKGFVLGLFLVGSLINIPQLKELGAAPVILGVVLWIVSSVWSLSALLYGFI